ADDQARAREGHRHARALEVAPQERLAPAFGLRPPPRNGVPRPRTRTFARCHPFSVLLADVAATSSSVAATASRTAKITALAELLRRATPEEVAVAVAFLSGAVPGGSTGIGWAALRDVPAPSAPPATLEPLEANAAFARIRESSGRGSRSARSQLL